jgi:hypothetical protein
VVSEERITMVREQKITIVGVENCLLWFCGILLFCYAQCDRCILFSCCLATCMGLFRFIAVSLYMYYLGNLFITIVARGIAGL